MRLVRKAIATFRGFRAAQAGAAAVEFALIVPIMLFLYVGANEASVLISMDRKVQLISGAVGDLVSRSEGEISPGTLLDYVKVASGIVSPYVVNDMVQIVTQVQVEGGKAKVDWSQGFMNQVADNTLNRAKGSTYPLPPSVIAIAEGKFVIVAETRVPYTPLYGIVYASPITLYQENYYLPRFGGNIYFR